LTAEDKPRFGWGQRVRAVEDLFNDGTYPEQPVDALLVRKGEAGEIVKVGKHVNSQTVVYLVEFENNQAVGCVEAELMSLEPREEAS
jgi:nitrogen fixation protein NifZ